jgi:Zn-dependent peptidase ImmA (M78 family)/DNA-binding XRE family transcriptional regulator
MNGERLRQARELCGLTQQELADLAKIAQSAVAQIEAGRFAPTSALENTLAVHTGFDLEFLNDPDSPIEFPVGTLLYRGKSKVSPKDKARAHRLAQMLFEIAISLKSKFRPIPVTLPRLGDETPVEAARVARSHFGLSPDTPLKNITGLLERAGVLILRVPLEVDGLDGFSAWVGKDRDIPMICLIGSGIGYRDRYTISEEAGHLIMHTPLNIPVEQAEDDVKLFVGEFVLPEDAMRREMTAPVTLASLSSLRPRWGASIQFLAARSRQLEITTPNQFKYLMQQMSMRGWRTNKREPGDESIPQEKPQFLAKIIESMYGVRPDLKRMRREIGIPMGLLKSLLGAHGIIDNPSSSSVLEMMPRRS